MTREEYRAKQRAYYAACRSFILARRAALRAAMSEEERRREYNENRRAYYAANREKCRKANARRAAKFRSMHLDEVRAKHREACRRANAVRRSPHEQLLCLGIVD